MQHSSVYPSNGYLFWLISDFFLLSFYGHSLNLSGISSFVCPRFLGFIVIPISSQLLCFVSLVFANLGKAMKDEQGCERKRETEAYDIATAKE